MAKRMTGKTLLFTLFGIAIAVAGFAVLCVKFIKINPSQSAVRTPVMPSKLYTATTEEDIYFGRFHYTVRCAKCHHNQSPDTDIPSLSNTSLSPETLYHIIYSGIPNTNMKGWGNKLQPDDIVRIIKYIQTLSTETATQ